MFIRIVLQVKNKILEYQYLISYKTRKLYYENYLINK